MNSRRLIVELPVEDKAYQRTNECDELPPPHGLSPRPGSQKTITGLEWVGGVHRNKKTRPMSALVRSRHSALLGRCPLCPQKRTLSDTTGMSALCRFCCRSPLQAFLVGDSVAVMRFATGAGDDGAAGSRSGAVFLFISSRGGGVGRSSDPRDRCGS